jgi:hypothetical protein
MGLAVKWYIISKYVVKIIRIDKTINVVSMHEELNMNKKWALRKFTIKSIYKWKNDTYWNCSRNQGGGIKESGGGGDFKYDIFDTS